jgi:large subunit ribosomal protein L12
MEYVYAALMLHKLGKEINEENLKNVMKAAGSQADEAKVKTLLASLKDVDIEAELEKAVVAAAAPAAGAAPAEEKKEEKKEEKAEEAAEGLSSLFG